VLTRDTIYEAFYDDSVTRGFLHSHSYTGNALACRAALATLDIFEADDVIATNREKAAAVTARAAELSQHPRVRDFRSIGMIWAFEVAVDAARVARKIYEAALERELLLRPIGSTVYLMPPYTISGEEQALLIDRTLEIVESL
jgi:adenosylmethionine-8-amino-7-oxononanoate aminotransferase